MRRWLLALMLVAAYPAGVFPSAAPRLPLPTWLSETGNRHARRRDRKMGLA